jgi:NAD(P)-dependent dehydrogenase (short-subunit alcohol dehydrogenase family)
MTSVSKPRVRMPSQTTKGRFVGKPAIATGPGAGIGRATAVRLATEEAKVVATDLAQDRRLASGGGGALQLQQIPGRDHADHLAGHHHRQVAHP